MKWRYFALLTILCGSIGYGQNGFVRYHSQSDFLLASPGAFRVGMNGYQNPALLSHVRGMELTGIWTSQDTLGNSATSYSRWGVFSAFHNMGFGAYHENLLEENITDYRISTAAGNKTFAIGYSYGWSTGNATLFDRRSVWTVGMLLRPEEHISIGVMGTQAVGGTGQQLVVDGGIRPFGNEWCTLFGDYSISEYQKFKTGNWSAGAIVEPIRGLRFAARYFDTKMITAGVQVSLGSIGYSFQTHLDDDGNTAFNTNTIRIGEYDRDIVSALIEQTAYVKMDMNGPVVYQKNVLFDSRKTLKSVLEKIDAAATDPDVKGIALNLSGMQMNREMIWEVRNKLKDFRKQGKHVVAYIDKATIDLYHLASVCDRIVLDPQGTVFLEGYLMGRTYLKSTLEKIGLGFDEWRFFKYKSALESYARESMSDADREQRQELVNDLYTLAQQDICEGRGLTPSEFDTYVNDIGIFLPKDALEKKLVDTLGRWDAVESVVRTLENGSVHYTSGKMLRAFVEPYDNCWGEEPKIAVIYALGACAMDNGITARSLVKVVERVASRGDINAVVLRVDSPGGDGMASDIVAEALKKCSARKPVIVSQGYVAASGGYWLSMYADTIVAAPNTITGSIGVIGGWVYNKELKDKLGMSTDHVKAGKHADLPFGLTLPIIGLTIPDRNLTPDEYGKMEYAIKAMYDDFVGKVASGRGMDTAAVAEIAQGRVWSGVDGLQNGLVDVIGGMWDAIQIAKERAGIEKDERYSILEFPEKGLIDINALLPSPFQMRIEDDPLIQHLKFRLDNNGIPMPALPVEDWDNAMLELGE